MFALKPFQHSFGLDVSDLKLRLVQLKKNGRKVSVSGFGEIVIPEGSIIGGDIKMPELVQNSIVQLVKNTHGNIKGQYVIASLPERKTFIKVITIPSVPSDELAGAIKWQTQQHVPISMDESYIDWQILDSFKDQGGVKQRVLVGVAPKVIVDQYTDVFKRSGLTPIALETESACIVRALMPIDQKNDESVLIVDMGASRTSLIIYAENALQFTTTHTVSGFMMSQSIARSLKLTLDEAEKAKVICGFDPTKAKGAIRAILIPVVRELLMRIQETIEYSPTSVSGKKIEKVVLCGGASQLVGLKEYFQEALHLPIVFGDPLMNITNHKRVIIPAGKRLSYTTALGAALRGLSPSNILS